MESMYPRKIIKPTDSLFSLYPFAPFKLFGIHPKKEDKVVLLPYGYTQTVHLARVDYPIDIYIRAVNPAKKSLKIS